MSCRDDLFLRNAILYSPMRLTLSLAILLLAGCAAAPEKAAAPAQLEATPATITSFTEGPTADAEGNIYFSEIINQRILKLSVDGKLSVFRENSNTANGLLFDGEGRLVAAAVAAPGGEAERQPDSVSHGRSGRVHQSLPRTVPSRGSAARCQVRSDIPAAR